MEAHFGTVNVYHDKVKDYFGALETHAGAREAPLTWKKAHPGAFRSHPSDGADRLFPE